MTVRIAGQQFDLPFRGEVGESDYRDSRIVE
jgi:hypothetical protein